MNSQLLPVADFSLIQLRVDERVEAAAKSRVLRQLSQRTGAFTIARRITSNLLVRIGQRLSPATPLSPENECGDEYVLIPLAR